LGRYQAGGRRWRKPPAHQIQRFAMRGLLHLLFVLALAAGLSACATTSQVGSTMHKSLTSAWSHVWPRSKHPSTPAAPPQRYAAHTATLDVTFGLHVAGVTLLPEDFVPNMSRPPLWLQGGSEIGVIGTRANRGAMLGFSGPHLAQERVVIEDAGRGAPGGRLLDAALSPDHHSLAVAVATAAKDGLEVNLIGASGPGGAFRIASLEGEFAFAQLTWLNTAQIALATQAVTPMGGGSASETVPPPASSLYLISAGPPTSIRRLDGIKCPLSPLAFSPNGAFAVAQGAASAPPAIIDVRGQQCEGFPSNIPVKVLGWAPNSTAFLYRTANRSGVIRFDMLTGRSAPVAISSGAAAYADDGTIIALGSQDLTWQRAIAEPMTPVKMQIALFDPRQSMTTINSLGFATQPALLEQSTMVFSPVSNNAVIDTLIASTAGPERLIIEYSYPARAAFVLAHGAAAGPVAISWSPDGRQIAILDGNAISHTLAVITPPK
jgi:hypothetical protein